MALQDHLTDKKSVTTGRLAGTGAIPIAFLQDLSQLAVGRKYTITAQLDATGLSVQILIEPDE